MLLLLLSSVSGCGTAMFFYSTVGATGLALYCYIGYYLLLQRTWTITLSGFI